MLKAALLVLLLLIPAILGYGYWHARTHATLHVSLSETSAAGRGDTPILHSDVSFLDTSGAVIARARSEDPIGVVYLAEPSEYACHAIEKKAPFDTAARDEWRRCFQRQSRWLASVVPEIASIEVVTGACRLQVPATFSSYSDWWLWWVPHPHIGGIPYRNYSIYIRIDPLSCSSIRA